jgi:hypothetical protein
MRFAVLLSTAVLAVVLGASLSAATPLDDYIALPDPTYSYFDTVSDL